MSTDRIEVYRTTVRRKWRWRYVAANGNILADSGQGYTRRIDCLAGASAVTGVPVLGESLGFSVELGNRVLRVVEVAR